MDPKINYDHNKILDIVKKPLEIIIVMLTIQIL